MLFFLDGFDLIYACGGASTQDNNLNTIYLHYENVLIHLYSNSSIRSYSTYYTRDCGFFITHNTYI